jgi:Dioxygenases related to 2-nitropropane dioxygenase
MGWSSYGKRASWLTNDVFGHPTRMDVPVAWEDGLNKFEGPNPAYWVAHGYVLIAPDSRGVFMSEGDIPAWGSAVIEAGDMSTVVTGMSTGEPCRQIENKLSERLLAAEAENSDAVAAELIREISSGSLKKAMVDGDVEFGGAVMAGQIVPLVKEVRSAAEIIDSTIAQCKALLEKMPQFV